MSHTIQVSEVDIANGKRFNSELCPIALALSRHFSRSVIVRDEWWRFIGSRFELLRPLPPEVALFIYNFDTGLPVEPIEFEVEQV
jgi:hypothetical protein